MFFRQYYLECLSHASYLIGDISTGRAVVVDPQRDVGEYLADAEANSLQIVKVLETHFHADFLSGHLELAARTGSAIGYGRAAEGRVEFPIETYRDGDLIRFGEVVLEVRETPGHTPDDGDPVSWTPDYAGDRVEGSPSWAVHRSTRTSSVVTRWGSSSPRAGRSLMSPGRSGSPRGRCGTG